MGDLTSTYHQDHCTASDEISFEALLYDPLGGVDIEGGQYLLATSESRRVTWGAAKTYIIKQKNLGGRVNCTSEGDPSLHSSLIIPSNMSGDNTLLSVLRCTSLVR